MIINRPEDVLHKVQLLKLLMEIADNNTLSHSLFFKGGTAASMLGFLDRFSVDLDFDINPTAIEKEIRSELKKLFSKLSFVIDSENESVPFFILKYDAPKNTKNTLKLSVFTEVIKSNVYKSQFLPEIGRTLSCQTIETMFANKLVTPIDRYEKHKKIASRDIYDINHFFINGYSFRNEVIEERSGLKTAAFFHKLIDFIEKNVTETTINEDLNTLLPNEKFQKIRYTLKPETLFFLRSYVSIK